MLITTRVRRHYVIIVPRSTANTVGGQRNRPRAAHARYYLVEQQLSRREPDGLQLGSTEILDGIRPCYGVSILTSSAAGRISAMWPTFAPA